MSSYRRFVTYLFQYKNYKKEGNCGFAKVEVNNNHITMQIQIKINNNQEYQVFLFANSSNGIAGIKLGEMQTKDGLGTAVFLFEAEQIMNTKYSIHEIRGIYLLSPEENFLASQWDDEEIDWKSFYSYIEETEEELTEELETEEINEIHATQVGAAVQQINSYMTVWDQQWMRFTEGHPICHPFDEESNIYAIRIQLKDIKILPKNYLSLANNSFLLHGYFNYKHMILGYQDTETERKWFLGVPGCFQNQEQLLAGIFGFSEFKTKHVTKQKTGEFGYWIRFLNLSNQ